MSGTADSPLAVDDDDVAKYCSIPPSELRRASTNDFGGAARKDASTDAAGRHIHNKTEHLPMIDFILDCCALFLTASYRTAPLHSSVYCHHLPYLTSRRSSLSQTCEGLKLNSGLSKDRMKLKNGM